MDVSRRSAGHDGLSGGQAPFDQRCHVFQVGGASHDRAFLPEVEQMDLAQVDSPVPEQSDGMGRYQHLPPCLAIHPCHGDDVQGLPCTL